MGLLDYAGAHDVEARLGMGHSVIDEDDLERNAQEIASRRLLDQVSYRDLGKHYGYAPSTIHRRLMRWLQEGRFELVDRHEGGAPRLLGYDEDLENALVRKTSLWRARVAYVAGAESATTDSYLGNAQSTEVQAAYKAADDLHRALGQACASQVLVHQLRRGIRVGVTSGRGVAYTVDSLVDNPWAGGFEGVNVVSLCSGAKVGSWRGKDRRSLDADENAFALAVALGVPEQHVTLMGDASGDGDVQWDFVGPNLILAGLGCLNTGHHLLRPRARLGKMAEPLSRIERYQAREPELKFAVAEIGHRLFPVHDGLPGYLLEAIEDVNSLVRAAPPHVFENAEVVMLVAGGAQKLDPLVRLVTGHTSAPIELRNLILVTDAWTAQQLLIRVGRN
jgi:DNA-binding transcriptional regulator LsrR (DeoR family)